MGKYFITINETNQHGKALKNMLTRDENVTLMNVDDFDKAFDKILDNEMKGNANEPLLTYGEAKAELAKMKKRLAK